MPYVHFLSIPVNIGTNSKYLLSLLSQGYFSESQGEDSYREEGSGAVVLSGR